MAPVLEGMSGPDWMAAQIEKYLKTLTDTGKEEGSPELWRQISEFPD
ncbi:MAG: hypothetical protein SFV17_14680 [Candidatus Obscuribacter sp.]|nr:hypothetical protein [Candidatus Obscuribacter sp.]